MLDLSMVFKNPKEQKQYEKEYKSMARTYPLENSKSLQARIFNLLLKGNMYSHKQIQSMLKLKFGSEQIRKLRQKHYGGHKVDCIRTDDKGITKYVYKLNPNKKVMEHRKWLKQMQARRKKSYDKWLRDTE